MTTSAPEPAPWWVRKKTGKRAVSAMKTGLAAVLCLWLGRLLRLEHSYWAAISAIVVMGSDSAVTWTSSRDRLLGTAVGALLGWATADLWHGHTLLYGLAVMFCLLVCSLLEFEKAGRLGGVALTIIVLLRLDNSARQAAIARFLEVSLGILVAMAVTYLIFPQTEKTAAVAQG